MPIVYRLLATLVVAAGSRGLLQWLATDRPRSPGWASVLGVGWLGGASTGVAVAGLPILTLLLALLGTRIIRGIRTGEASEPLQQGVVVATTRMALGLGVGLVITLSGFPSGYANAVYAGKRWVDAIAGLFLLGGGLVLLSEVIGVGARGSRRRLAMRLGGWRGEILGLALALALYHDLDPTFDAVFAGVGMMVAASHSPWTVGFFSAGLTGVYVPLTMSLASLAQLSIQPFRRKGLSALAAVTALFCLAVVIFGFAMVVGTYHAFSRRLGFTP